MGLLSGLIGGFAQGGLTVAQEQIKADQRQSDMQMANDLETKRQQMILQLADQYKQADEQRVVAQTNAARQQMVTSTNDAAQGYAQARANATNNQVSTDASDAAGIYQNSTLSDDDKQKGLIAAQQYGDNAQVAPVVTTRDRVMAGVDAGYEKASDLMKMDQQDAANLIGGRRLDIQDRLAANAEQRTANAADASDKRDSARWGQIAATTERAQILADARASKEDKDKAALNLNTTVATQNKLILDAMESKRSIRKDAPDRQDQLDAIDNVIRTATTNRDLAQDALGDTLKNGTYKGARPNPAALAGSPAASAPNTPTSQAAFDALPSGAIYVNPADGKTYKKK